MATTKIKKVKHHLNRVVNYAKNENKTAEYTETEMQGLRDVMAYAVNSSKTEKHLYVSSINCIPNIARRQMEGTKRRWNKNDGILAFHGFQSFKPGETTPQIAHEIGKKLARELWGDRFEVVIGTHLDKHHLHNHFVLNSVSFKDGGKFNDCLETYALMRRVSDRLCKQYALSVIEPKGKGKHYAIWLAEQNGQPTEYSMLRDDVDRAIKASITMSQFVNTLKDMGFEVKMGKHIAIRAKGKEHFTRLKTLGENYTEEAIKECILSQIRRELPKYHTPKIRRVKVYGDFKLGKVTWKGLRALYFFYLQKLRKAQNPTSSRDAVFSPSRALVIREDLLIMDKLSQQSKFLCAHQFDTKEQVQSYLNNAQAQIQTLCAERKKLYGATDKSQIPVLNKKIRALRGDVKLCKGIMERSQIIEEKNAQLEQMNRTEEKHESIRRSSRTDRQHGDQRDRERC